VSEPLHQTKQVLAIRSARRQHWVVAVAGGSVAHSDRIVGILHQSVAGYDYTAHLNLKFHDFCPKRQLRDGGGVGAMTWQTCDECIPVVDKLFALWVRSSNAGGLESFRIQVEREHLARWLTDHRHKLHARTEIGTAPYFPISD
jgi:hypothetical protein